MPPSAAVRTIQRHRLTLSGPAVFYRRLGPRAFGPVRVSPAGMSVSAHGEAPPILQILPGGGLTVAYAAALPGKWKKEIRLQSSTDGGAHWGAAELLHPERIGAHSYLSAAVTAAGEPVFAWLDDSTGHMGLHAKLGAAPPVTLDSESCQCCGTALLAGREGEVWLAYRDSDDDIRDFRVLRTDGAGGFDRGRTLSDDQWKLNGCPPGGHPLARTSRALSRGSRAVPHASRARPKPALFLGPALRKAGPSAQLI